MLLGGALMTWLVQNGAALALWMIGLAVHAGIVWKGLSALEERMTRLEGRLDRFLNGTGRD